ncbi:zinc finger protein 830 [Arapaima gigas]
MASSGSGKGKKVVSQDELRRLMKEKQKESTDRKKRIDSPFAKYPFTRTFVGHLLCVLCNVPVKSEILWQTHVLSKLHKEKVAELKGTKSGGTVSQKSSSSAVKRKTPDAEHPDGKRSRGTGGGGAVDLKAAKLPADFFDTGGAPKSMGSKQPSGLGFLAGNYDNDDDEEDGGKNLDVAQTHYSLPPAATSGLPADFFDSSIPTAPPISHSGSVLKADEPEKPVDRKENTAEALPEGFFDDPVTDAKVRKVDAPKDLMDKEWEEFQKEMRHVNNASEAIVAEEDEDGRLERQIDEIDQQIECFRRVELLRDRMDLVKKTLQGQQSSHQREDHGIEEDEEEEELLNLLSRDWRAKGALA